MEVDPSERATIKEMLLSKQFVVIYLMNCLSVFSGFYIVNQTVNYGEANGFTNTSYLSTVASIGAIFNAARFVWSWLLDYYPYREVYGALLGIQIVLNFTIFFVNQNAFLYAVWVCLFMFCEGGHFVLAPNILKKIFGSKTTQLYGFFFSFASLCSIITILLQDAFLKDTTKSYNEFFIFNGLLSMVSFVLLMTLFTPDKYVPLVDREQYKTIQPTETTN